MSVIVARCSRVLRSSDIVLRDSSVRAGQAVSLGMTRNVHYFVGCDEFGNGWSLRRSRRAVAAKRRRRLQSLQRSGNGWFSSSSCRDHPLPIGYDQTISQPYIVAFMTEQLHPKPSDRVLEIGTGSGYQAAILAELVAEVYTIELAEPLARNAEATLARLGYKNVHVKVGDGYKGWPENAPFDAIIVTCAPDRVPRPLTDQLKDGGRMIIPVGNRFAQELYLLEKKNGQLKESAVLPVRFVPMAGEAQKGK